MDIQSILNAKNASSSSGMDRKGVLEAAPQKAIDFEDRLNAQTTSEDRRTEVESPESSEKPRVAQKDKELSVKSQEETVSDDSDVAPASLLAVPVSHSIPSPEVSEKSETMIMDDHALEVSLAMLPGPAQDVSSEDETKINHEKIINYDHGMSESLMNEVMKISDPEIRVNPDDVLAENVVDRQSLETLTASIQSTQPSQPTQVSLPISSLQPVRSTQSKLFAESLKNHDQSVDAVAAEGSDHDVQSDILGMPLNDKIMAQALPMEGAPQEKPLAFKEMVDGLWIHQNLKSENPLPESKKVIVNSLDLTRKIDGSSFLDQIRPLMEKVKASQTGGEMTLNLRPAELGSMRVEIQVDKTDVKVALFAEKSETREVLQRQWSDLKNQLSSVGLKLEDTPVRGMASASPQRDRDTLPQQRQSQEQASQQRHHDQGDFDEAWKAQERMIA